VPNPFRTPPGKSHDLQAEASIAAGRAGPSHPLPDTGPMLTEALRHMDRQHPTGSHNSKNLESMGRTHQKGEGWIPSVPSTTGHLKHIFLSQPVKGSLQLDRSNTARQTPIRAGDRAAGRAGRGRGKRSGGAQSPSPNPSATGQALLPPSSWALK